MTSIPLAPDAGDAGPQTLRWTLVAALLASGSYLLARYIGLGPLPGPWAYWPIHGLLCGILYRRPGRTWAPIVVGAVVAQVLTIFLVRGDLAGGASVIGALAGATQAMLGAWILRRHCVDESPLENPRVLAWFVVVGVTFAPLVVSPISAFAFASGLGLPVASTWWPLFVGNSLSMLLFAPLLMQRWDRDSDGRSGLAGTPEVLLCVGALAAVALISFSSAPSWLVYVALPYAVFPLLAWAALRCGPRWTVVSIVMLATIASWNTARGSGPFAHPGVPMAEGVFQLEAYLAFVAFTGLLLSALTEERRRSFAQTAIDEAIRSAFFESSTALMMLKDVSGRNVMVNRATEEIYGVPRERLLGRTPAEYMEPATAQTIETHDRRVLERGEAMVFEETHAAGGRERQLLMTRFPVRDADGVTRYLGMIGRDETVERELSARLQRAQRVELVGQMAAGLAHDLNNLLFVLVSNAEHLSEQRDRPAEELEILGEMKDAGTQATRLTSRLLSMGRASALTRGTTRVHVDAALRELEPLLKAMVRGQIDLTVTLGAPDAFVVTDPTAIEQIVLNLIANARDAITGDGQISLTSSVIPGAMLRLVIADSGAGMTVATMARVFEPFFTTKSDARGTGLGLYTTSLLVQQAGGTIHVASTPDAGTTFTIELPVAG